MNQPSLYREILDTMVKKEPLDSHFSCEKDHGRHTEWHCSVYDAADSVKTAEWSGLKRFVHIKCFKTETATGEETESDRLYITNLYCSDAEMFNAGIRGHWGIENSLHWVKDKIHNEDGNKIRDKNGPCNVAVISSFAINCHRSNGDWSITEASAGSAADLRKVIIRIRT